MTVTMHGDLLAGRYRLARRIAAGGMGSVWEAWDELLQRPVAIKELVPQSGFSDEDTKTARSRVVREARITARLHHPHAVTLYDVIDHAMQPRLVLQFVPSRILSSVLAEQGQPPVAFVTDIAAQVAATAARTASPTPTPTSPQPGSSRSPAGPNPAQFATAITDYYALLPGDTDLGWARLTNQFQTGTARNRPYYQHFWDSIQRVTATDAHSAGPGTVEARITYLFTDGRTAVELTRYTLLQRGGTLMIDSSTVLSSTTQ